MTKVKRIQCLGLVLLFLHSSIVSFHSFLYGKRFQRGNILLRMSSGDDSTHFDYLIVGGGSGGAVFLPALWTWIYLTLVKFRSCFSKKSSRIWQESRSD